MSLLSEIQGDAVDSTVPIAGLLRKCKVLAARLGNRDLAEWVELELEGYKSKDQLPSYRVLDVLSRGDFAGPLQSAWKNLGIPPAGVPEKHREVVSIAYVMEPIGSLEQTLQASDGSSLRSPWPPDLIMHLSDKLIEGMTLVDAWREIPIGAAVAVVETVKSRVLGFVLAIEKELKVSQFEEKNLDSISKETVQQVFNNHIYGDVTNLAQASSGLTQIGVDSVLEGDVESLKHFMDEAGVEPADVKALGEAIESDSRNREKGKIIGENVGNCIGQMVSKAASGTWDIATSVAAKVLAEAIAKFYGLP